MPISAGCPPALEAIYEQGREAVVSVLLALSAQNERLQAQVETLTARVACQSRSAGRNAYMVWAFVVLR